MFRDSHSTHQIDFNYNQLTVETKSGVAMWRCGDKRFRTIIIPESTSQGPGAVSTW